MALNPATGVDEELVAAFASPEAREALTHQAAANATPAAFDPQQLEAAVQTPMAAPAAPVVAPPPAPVVDPASDAEAAAKAIAAVGPDVKTSRVQETKGMKDARAGLKALDLKEAEGIKARTNQNVDKAEKIAANEALATAERDAMETRAAAERAKIEVQKVEAVKAAKTARDKLAADHEKDFFSEKGAAAKWGAAIAVGLGAFSATWNGGPNHAWNIMEKMMDQHAAREKARLLRAKEAAELAGEDVTRIDAALRDFDTITRPGMEKSMLEKAAQRRRELLSKFGATDAQLEGDKLLRKATEAALEREMRFETGLAARVETDNSAQNAAKRAAAAASVTGGDKPYDKLSEGERKSLATIKGAQQSLRVVAEQTKDLDAKDRRIWNKIVAETQTIRESDPEKAWSSFNKITGSYWSQMSENGQRRLGRLKDVYQDLERTPSGGVIGPQETIGFVDEASRPGGLGHALGRMRAMSIASGQPAKVGQEIDELEKSLGLKPTASAPAPAAPSPRATAAVRAEAASLLRSAKDPADRKWLEWARDNPGDPKAAQIIQANR